MARRAGLERLWAPWRMAYVGGAARAADCLFCRVARSRGGDRQHLVIQRSPQAFVMLNRYPYNPGHLLVAVARHVESVADLTAEEREAFLAAVALAERALAAAYRPDGMNLGANLGRVAGAGFPGHLHLHVVPRWNGDTNFMPVIGEVKVLPESLEKTWSRLRAAARPGATRARGRAVPRARRSRVSPARRARRTGRGRG